IPLQRARLLSSAHSLAAASLLRTDYCATPPSAARAPSRRRRAWCAAAAGGAGEADARAAPLATAAGDRAVRAVSATRSGCGSSGSARPGGAGAVGYAQLCSIMPRSHHRRKGYPLGSLLDFTTDADG
ncbi:unnamed protein product, partial [Closterium sp. Yama58-4]